MKVCFVADSSPDLTGGAQSLLSLMGQLKKKNVSLFLVGHRDSEQMTEARKMGVSTKVIPGKIFIYRQDINKKTAKLKYPAKRSYNRMMRIKMAAYLKEIKPDVVHLNSMFSCVEWAAAAKECGIPYVWHIREYVESDHNRYILGESYYYKYLRAAKRVITISKDVQHFWSKKLGKKCDLVYNGLDLEKYSCDASQKLINDTVECVIVGRIVEGKRQMDAVSAVESLIKKGIKNIHLKIVGYRKKDAYELALHEYIRSHKLDDYVELIEFTSSLRDIYSASDIGLVCSAREAFGRITIEYMLAGCLAIGTDSGGTPELISDGKTGLLYEPANVSALAEKLEWVIGHREEAKSLLLAGQQNAKERFSIENTAANVYRIYREVLGDKD